MEAFDGITEYLGCLSKGIVKGLGIYSGVPDVEATKTDREREESAVSTRNMMTNKSWNENKIGSPQQTETDDHN